ncbi:hypothetical protein CEP52_014839 [Fusarium oligoseptatum]|uniref:Uncharacterized protein n=1 Tax=Fusarium oligoseptatum TaxID=2604345 RepID=A0A428SIP5_9HYPO|nr:hypothetical protein CEP52_014839 [Fusarium oligoseptatum]
MSYQNLDTRSSSSLPLIQGGGLSSNKRHEDNHDERQDGTCSANERQGDWSADFFLDSETSRQGRSPVSTMSVTNTDTRDGEDEGYSASSVDTNTLESDGEDDEDDGPDRYQTLLNRLTRISVQKESDQEESITDIEDEVQEQLCG